MTRPVASQSQNIARIAKAALQKLPGKSSFNVNFLCPVCPDDHGNLDCHCVDHVELRLLTMLTMLTMLTRKHLTVLWKKDGVHQEDAKQSNCQTVYLTRCARIAASIALNDESLVTHSLTHEGRYKAAKKIVSKLGKPPKKGKI